MKEITEPMKNTKEHNVGYEQLELFPSITDADTDQVQVLLEQYCFMKSYIREFEESGELLYLTDIEGEKARRVFQDETKADKTANAVILHEIRKWKYNQFKMAVTGIEMAHRIILDTDSQKVIHARYFLGLRPTRAMLEVKMTKGMYGRRLDEGIESIGNTLKIMELLERIKWTY